MQRLSVRIFALLLVLVFTLSMTACDSVMPAEEETEDESQTALVEGYASEDIQEYNIESLKRRADREDSDPAACFTLGLIYDYGLGGERQSLVKAKGYYEKSYEADYAEAGLALGYMYLNGAGVEKDLAKALDYFEECLEAGLIDANAGIGRVYMDESYEERDDEAAYEYFTEGAREGSRDCVYLHSYMKETGRGTTQSFAQALAGYIAVVSDGIKDARERYAVHNALVRLGIMYSNGKGVDRDYNAAYSYFSYAASAQHAPAKYYLGVMHELGYIGDPDPEAAYRLYTDAAASGYAPALNQLGFLYCNGIGVTKNYRLAHYYQGLAAGQGYAPAMINLGYLYENGLGCNKNLDTALSYYRSAQEAGYAGANAAVVRVETLIR